MKTSIKSKLKKLLIMIILIIVIVLIYFAYSLYRLAPKGAKYYSSYTFSQSKNYLDDQIDYLVKVDDKISRVKIDNNPTDKFYNTGRYFTVTIDSINFTFKFQGDSLDWVNSSDSIKIFLTSIKSSNKKKLSYKEKLKIVEEQFINKLRD